MTIKKEKTVYLTNDYAFKRIFGKPGNEKVTKDLLNSILSEKVSNIELDTKTTLDKDIRGKKAGILDIKAKLNNEVLCDIELQVTKQEYIEKRILYYWSRLYISNFKERNDYSDLKKTISILIADFELDILKKMPQIHTKWEIKESEYGKIILTNVFELHILEIPKLVYQLNEECNKNLLNWLKFIKNPELVEEDYMKENEAMAQAKKELEKFNQNEHERYLAEQREIYWHEVNSFKGTGERQGLKKGIAQEKRKIAKKMLEENFDIKIIMKMTELTEIDINSLKNNN
ncbi:MAG: Rpn family recombination-promoting nuclease/putative transposase [Clostridia bacterium]|nr:Rpn family recombination-promoting nuclease/putative transposase [Clostridia bacterium]